MHFFIIIIAFTFVIKGNTVIVDQSAFKNPVPGIYIHACITQNNFNRINVDLKKPLFFVASHFVRRYC